MPPSRRCYIYGLITSLCVPFCLASLSLAALQNRLLTHSLLAGKGRRVNSFFLAQCQNQADSIQLLTMNNFAEMESQPNVLIVYTFDTATTTDHRQYTDRTPEENAGYFGPDPWPFRFQILTDSTLQISYLPSGDGLARTEVYTVVSATASQIELAAAKPADVVPYDNQQGLSPQFQQSFRFQIVLEQQYVPYPLPSALPPQPRVGCAVRWPALIGDL